MNKRKRPAAPDDKVAKKQNPLKKQNIEWNKWVPLKFWFTYDNTISLPIDAIYKNRKDLSKHV